MVDRYFARLVMVCFVFALIGDSVLAQELREFSRPQAESNDQITKQYPNSSGFFLENVGQFPDGVLFQTNTPSGIIRYTSESIIISRIEQSETDPINHLNPSKDLLLQSKEQKRGVNIKLSFNNSNSGRHLEPFGRLDTHISYFIGKSPDDWYPDIPVWSGVRYIDLYPGIDLEITSENGHISPRMVLKPSGDINNVQMSVEGGDEINLLPSPNTTSEMGISISTLVGPIIFPLIDIIDTNGKPISPPASPRVNGKYVDNPFNINLGEDSELNRFQFQKSQLQNEYNLQYSTYIWGNDSDWVYGIDVDDAGNTFLTGLTISSNFPKTPGAFDTTPNGDYDTYVVKMNPSGSGLIYATLIGGSEWEWGIGIEVDDDGYAYITGETLSPFFPTTTGAYDETHNGDYDGYVAKFSPLGNSLIYSTYIGGNAHDRVMAIELDTDGTAYLSGFTYSSNFPYTDGAYDTVFNGDSDSFLAKITKDGSDLIFSSYFGGSEFDSGAYINTDDIGGIYISGFTGSDDFPKSTGAYDVDLNGIYDIYVSKFTPDASDLVYSTLIGGSDIEFIGGMSVDSDRNVYVLGDTTSDDFPYSEDAFDTTYNGANDIFIFILNSSGSNRIASTYLGGNNEDLSGNLFVKDDGKIYLVGSTKSVDFPISAGAIDGNINGGYDVVLAKFNNDLTYLEYATFIGGGNGDSGENLLVDEYGNIYFVGRTFSLNFPTTAGSFDTTYNGSGDIFLTKLVKKRGLASWTIMYYQAWDNNLDGPLDIEINALRNASNNSNIYIPVFRDYRNQSPVYEAYVDGKLVAHLSKNELNTGDSQTLSDFIDWSKSNYPAEHYALVIVDHGNGLSGTSQDVTDRDWLNPQDFRAALQTSDPFDVIFLEACLSANLEHAYQARDETMYYVASEAKMVAPLNHQYLNQISSQTSAKELAKAMAMAYSAQFNKDGQSRTISVGDMSKIEQVAQSTNAFASAIRSHRVDLGIAIWQLINGNTVQRFEENGDDIINEDDILADLYHFAQLVGWLGEPDLTTAADNLMTAIDEYIVYNSAWSRGTWDHNNAYGLSIILTKIPACYYTSDWLDFAGNVSWFCDQNIQMINQENGEWGQMLSDLITDNNPDALPQFEAPPLIPLDIHINKLYLPLSIKQ